MKKGRVLLSIALMLTVLVAAAGPSAARNITTAPAKPLVTSIGRTVTPTAPVTRTAAPIGLTAKPAADQLLNGVGNLGGIVLDVNGAPAAGVPVTAVQLGTPRGQTPAHLQAMTGRDGVFSFPNAAKGLYAVKAVSGHQMAGADLAVRDNRPARVHLVLQSVQQDNRGGVRN